jgi:hypothetical protein
MSSGILFFNFVPATAVAGILRSYSADRSYLGFVNSLTLPGHKSRQRRFVSLNDCH